METRNGLKKRVQSSPCLPGFPVLAEALRFKRQRRAERGGPSPCSPPRDQVTSLHGMAGKQLGRAPLKACLEQNNLGLSAGQQQNQITVGLGRYKEPHQGGQMKSTKENKYV